MFLNTKITIDFTALDNTVRARGIPCDGYTRLMMNDNTVYALTGKHFYEVRRQSYCGFPIIENAGCDVGEVVVLVDYEKMIMKG